MSPPYLVVSDTGGNIFEIPEILMVGMSRDIPIVPRITDLIPLPYGSDLFALPKRIAIGYDEGDGSFVDITEHNHEAVYPVAAFMAPAHLQIYRSAFRKLPDAPRLSLYSYSAVGWAKGIFYVAGIRIDPDRRQDLKFVDIDAIEKKALTLRKRFHQNRLVQHLINNCVFRYGCPAARNFVMGRWECPLPTSPGCNADCIGCISRQLPESNVEASQDRIAFVPTVKEIVEVAVPHLQNAPRALVSFGQGCEGEPLLVGDVVEESVREIRKRTKRGIININTNASRPEVIERLCKAGLNSIRVSINSAQENHFITYYRPQDYGLHHVEESLRIVRHFGGWTSLNYLMFPGFTDSLEEITALEKLIESVKPNMIQTRNLNIDPDWYIEELELQNLRQKFIGIRNWIRHIQKRFPWIKLGYFNPPKEEMKAKHFQFS